MRLAGAAAVVFFLVGCGSTRLGHGRATLWVTRDRGAHVLLVRKVPAGLTAMEALAREAKVKTAYGGRFVQSIDGVSGSLGRRHDWFYFVNGYEGDVSAAAYTLRPSDIEWWDYRSWAKQMSVPVVVGGFPAQLRQENPSTGGSAIVLAATPRVLPAARAIGRLLDVEVEVGRDPSRVAPRSVSTVLVVPQHVVFHVTREGRALRFVISARDAVRVARNPALTWFRYEGLR